MSLHTHAQFDFSSHAFKAAARALRNHPDLDPDRSARAAVMAALREDAPQVPRLPSATEPGVMLTASVIWITGEIGSGCHTLKESWVCPALRHGHRVLFVTPRPHLLGLPEGTQSEPVHGIRNSLSDPARQVVVVDIPPYERETMMNPFLSGMLIGAMETTLRAGPEPFWVILDEHTPSAGLLEALRGAPKIRTIVVRPDAEALESHRQTEDAWVACANGRLRVRQSTPDLTLDAVWPAPRPAHALRDPVSIPTDLVEGAEAVISRLSGVLSHDVPQTHTARLEAVARACGFSSWHAAEGRRGSR